MYLTSHALALVAAPELPSNHCSIVDGRSMMAHGLRHKGVGWLLGCEGMKLLHAWGTRLFDSDLRVFCY